MPVKDNVDGVSSEGVRFIIEEARKLNENKSLYCDDGSNDGYCGSIKNSS